MDIRTLLEDGTIHRAIEVLEHDSLCAASLKKTIDCLHGEMMRRQRLNKRLHDLEIKVMEHCTEV